jgi:hypothetical protein
MQTLQSEFLSCLYCKFFLVLLVEILMMYGCLFVLLFVVVMVLSLVVLPCCSNLVFLLLGFG